jgi:hypothetical protein
MSLIRANYRSSSYVEFIGDHVNNGTASVALVKFCKTLVNSLGIERLNETSLKISERGVYELVFPLSAKASSGITYYLGVGVNGDYDEFITGTTTSDFLGDTYRAVIQLEVNDIVTTLSRIEYNHETNSIDIYVYANPFEDDYTNKFNVSPTDPDPLKTLQSEYNRRKKNFKNSAFKDAWNDFINQNRK